MRRRIRRALAAGVVAATPALTGCDLIFGPGDSDVVVRYEADVLRVVEREHEWSPYPIAYLEAAVRGTNTSADTVRVSMPSCVLDLQAYTPEEMDPGADPLWRLRSRSGWPGGSGFGCFRGLDYTVPPGESFAVASGEIPLAEILGDSLPTGAYRFQVRLSSEVTRGTEARARDPVVDLGVVALPESLFPLQSDFYPRDGFTYRVSVETGLEPERDGIIRLSVEHTARNTSTLTRDLRRDCPVQLFAFRSREERDQIPVPRPVWQWPHQLIGCGSETMAVQLDPGGALTLTRLVPRRRFEFSGGEVEDFYYMVVIEADGRPMRFALDPS